MPETLTQADRTLLVHTPLGDDALLLTSFSGEEQMSRLYRYSLQLVSHDPDIQPADIVGKAVGFEVQLADGSFRVFHGLVSRLAVGDSDSGMRNYTLEVVPWLWFLTRTADCRIFQNMSVPDIIKKIFSDLGFTDFTMKTQADHPPWEYCVQYRETDFDFVSRLMEQEGIYYYFEHAKSKHTLVIADAKTAYFDCDENQVEHEYSYTGAAFEGRLLSWFKEYEFRPGKWAQTDYDFEKPSTSLMLNVATVINQPGASKFEIYDYPGEYVDMGYGRALTDCRMAEEETPYAVISGTSTCKSFSPGGKFKIIKHDVDSEKNKTYVLTSVQHSASDPLGGGGSEYSNSFSCIPADVLFVPARITPKPTVKGPQTAVVVGPSGEEIYTDKYGRVKVQFHWDREGKKNENSSCWIRVAQNWAGKNWGIVFNPRIGQEVIVDFLEGDPDRPIIVGRVYNAEQMPPYRLPDEQTKSTIKSRSSKQGTAENFNELRFEDKKGQEEVYFHAEKDFNRVVENNDTLKVGFEDKDKGNRKIEVFNNHTETIGAEKCEDGSRDTKVWNIDTLKVGAGEGKCSTGSQAISIWKDQTVEIGASKKEGNQTMTIWNNQTLTVGKSGSDGSQTVKIYKDRTVQLDTGNDDLKIDTGNQTTTIAKGNQTTTIKQGNQTTKLSLGKAETDAMTSIELKVGSNSIKIEQSGITIKGVMVKIEGQAMLEAKSPMTTVKGDGMLTLKGGLTLIN